jgi:ribulose 1,5-bisphosphate synthetase/thiazole synthase
MCAIIPNFSLQGRLPQRTRTMPRVVKVAVVGSGLAGLTAAYLLGLPHDRDDVEIEVHLFERVWYISLKQF